MQQTGTGRLKEQRLLRGWTLRDLAERCAEEGAPVGFSQLGRIERGDSVPNPRLRAALARLLDLDIINDFEGEAKAS